jgi:uncharacterized membrane protein
MRVIIGTVFLIGTITVFAALTAFMFVVQHLFAVSVLSMAVAAVVYLARTAKRRRLSPCLPAQQAAHYPGICATARTAAGRPAHWQAAGMSSAAIPSRARRSLEPRRSYP